MNQAISTPFAAAAGDVRTLGATLLAAVVHMLTIVGEQQSID